MRILWFDWWSNDHSQGKYKYGVLLLGVSFWPLQFLVRTFSQLWDVDVKANLALHEALLEALVEAALAGHDVTPLEPVEDSEGSYQARCRKCGLTTQIGDDGLRYSLLEEYCRN